MKLFQKVHCKAYMKRIHDGTYIQMYNKDGTVCENKYVTDYEAKAYAYKMGSEEPIADLSEFCGDSVPKVYRERTECEFDGVFVGYTRIKVSGRIGTDWETPIYGQEYGHCFKSIDGYPKVGVVYFQNNCKRYVLPEDMEGENDG